MSSASGKKEFFYIVVLILTFITVVIGATFALYSFLFSLEEEGGSAVYTGNLKIEYLSGDIIAPNFLRPTSVPNIDSIDDFDNIDNVYIYKFSVTNTGTVDINIDITANLSKNNFPDKSIMYALYDEDELYSDEENDDEEYKEAINSGYMKGLGDKRLVEGLSLKSRDINKESNEETNGETKKFVLLVWWNEKEYNQNPGAGCNDVNKNPDIPHINEENVCKDNPEKIVLEEYVLVGMIRIDANQTRKK